MKILIERDNFEEPKAGDIVQTNIGVCMKTYAGYVSLEGDNIGELNCDCDVKVSKVLIKSEDVVISKAQKEEIKEEIYEVEKPEKTDDIKIKYKDEFFISEGFIKFIGKLTYNDIKKIFKVDDSTMAHCLNDLVYGIYTIYYNYRDKLDDTEFMVNELKNMVYDFFNLYKQVREVKRTDKMLFDCIDYFKNLKAEDISEIYCNLCKEYFLRGVRFGSLEEIVYYFNKIGRLVEIGRIEHFYDSI